MLLGMEFQEAVQGTIDLQIATDDPAAFSTAESILEFAFLLHDAGRH